MDEVNAMLFPEKGVFSGYDFGDKWSDIKANPPKGFEVRDDDIKQLRRDVGSNAGSNGFYVGFGLDGEGKVRSFNAHVSGQQQNALTIRKLLDDVIAQYDKSIGNGSCTRTGTQDNSSSCTWEAPGKLRVNVSYTEMRDPISGSIDVSVQRTPPAKR